MTILETGKYIKQLFRIKICKGGAAAPAGKRYGIEAYLSAESNHVQLDPDRSGEMVPAGRRENACKASAHGTRFAADPEAISLS